MDERIKAVMAVVFAVPVDAIDDKVSPQVLQQWDSLNHMKLVVALEEEFEIEFDDNEILEMQSLALVKLILTEKGA